jgi:selenide,water dikinase
MNVNEWSLMKYVRGGGCASKIGPGDLSGILCDMKAPRDENVLAGFDDFEDAGVYLLTEELAIVQTVDFLTPVVNDPYLFGQIAAANALSDIYAMGATPRTALNIVGFSPKHYDMAVLKEIIKGGIAKMKEAGVSLIGGHSVDDVEIKYGLSVTGLVHPGKIIRNRGARAGDLLVLTKPLGTGIIIAAAKEELADQDTVARAVGVMTELNEKASRVLQRVGAHAATDVTGFGLIGHLSEMISESMGVELFLDEIPLMADAVRLYSSGVTSGGLQRNREFYGPRLDYSGEDVRVDLLFDPQTSGGLLFAIDADSLPLLKSLARDADSKMTVIGRFTDTPGGRIRVT